VRRTNCQHRATPLMAIKPATTTLVTAMVFKPKADSASAKPTQVRISVVGWSFRDDTIAALKLAGPQSAAALK